MQPPDEAGNRRSGDVICITYPSTTEIERSSED